MGERKKLDYDAFLARGAYDSFDIQYCLDRLMEADRAFQESDALLQATEDITGIDYASQSNRFYRILDAYGKLRRFMNRYVEEVWDVDKEFYSAVANGPAEALSHVRLEDIRIPNTLGLSNHDARAGTDIPLSHLSIKEFIREPEALNNNYVRGFAELFQEEVELAGEPMTLKEFLEELEKASTYSNDIHKPWLEILSGLLNMASFGVKPLYECICGYDIITGEQLSTGERVWTGVEAVLDFLPVFGVAKAAEKGLVKTLGAETVNGIENQLRGGVVRNVVNDTGFASKIGNNIGGTQNITKDDILEALDGVTEMSTEIAERIRNGDLGINVLSDELFESYLGCSSETVAVQIGDQIYVRRNSSSLVSDIVHEGTHAMDYFNGIDESIISSQIGEVHAYSAERTFQIESGIPIQFENEDDMMVHIWRNYGK